ncbi:DNA repair helicase [Artemisia annua]|uniref:DNA 3'-5' helicase n=1 Tax=Artemisia annua TaxID=35608 RepID=A0A2U1LZI6_ARTAN|nr:DNA repair helicase [Artemisia annua]
MGHNIPVTKQSAADIEEEEAYYSKEEYAEDDRYGDGEGKKTDLTKLELKPDHANRPLWACADGRIFLETFSPLYKQASDFLTAIAEPLRRPESLHEYNLTPQSLYAAVSVGLETETIISVLNKLAKTKLPKEMVNFIHASTANYGKVLKRLLSDEVISRARVLDEGGNESTFSRAIGETECTHDELLNGTQLAAAAEEKELHSFEIDPAQVENVKERCLPNALNYPLLEEYDFRNDTINPDVEMELKPQAQPRPYQEKSLSRMFGNGRARSGIIVLPCGAGKSLVGISAACRIKKSCLCLATNAVSVDQWAYQFKLWSNIPDGRICQFTSDSKKMFSGNAGVVVTTYSMLARDDKRTQESEKIIEEIRNREWGLLLMDEVHVVPANTFRKVISVAKAHCKLGLTATLVREDEKITDLNFLIGPKLYEANWLDLAKGGYIANVQCAEVWCPMTKEFFAEYLKKENSTKKQALCVMNPNKFRACEFLIRFHEQERGDKIIVFSDNIFALDKYAKKLHKPMIYGETRRQEAQRMGRILRAKGTHQDRMAGGKEENNAFFYSLVSTDTQEIYYSTKRQQFLIDQGYSFKVITSLPLQDRGAKLHYHSLEDQNQLLDEVLSAGDDAAGMEILKEDADDIALQKARLKGSMSARIVNKLAYMEVRIYFVEDYGAADIEEYEAYYSDEEPDEDDRYGDGEGKKTDFTKLELKPDHANRPLWACADGRIFLETFSPLYKQASDFLTAIAEPLCRPESLHEYSLTPQSLYAAVSVGLETETIISVLNKLAKTKLPKEMVDFIHASTANYGKVLKRLLSDEVISRARVLDEGGDESTFSKAIGKTECTHDELLIGTQLAAAAEEKELHSFEIDPAQVENVKERCLPNALNYPLLEEYDFRNDTINPDLEMELKPQAQPRPYQEKSLSRMFGNGRARSGIIVLPCGAGKSLVGVSAACRIKKSCLCLATNAVSVDQWAYQFKLWSNIPDERICQFTSDSRKMFCGNAGVLVTTYSMLAYDGKRSQESEKIIEEIRNREWGLLLMDEVHVVPANTFRRVISVAKSHCKLGLTATLVREDEKITHLNFLIGPKLYEANWLDLVKGGYIANVQCAEVRCPMTKEFFAEYLKKENSKKKQALCVMNPNKFRACEFLIRFHEQERGDKIIVFSDNIFALDKYAKKLHKPMIYGETSHMERTKILEAFKIRKDFNTVFLSKVGDNSIDIPEANVIIQISSHAGSRRQEAQRMGRILRAKGTLQDRMAGGKEENNAFFYSLVSTDTQEMYYSTKRQQFLIDQGYSFKVITSLPPPDRGAELYYHRLEDQYQLLYEVKSAGDDAAGMEILKDDADGKALYKAQLKGSMSARTGQKGALAKSKPKGAAKRHHRLFTQRWK